MTLPEWPSNGNGNKGAVRLAIAESERDSLSLLLFLAGNSWAYSDLCHLYSMGELSKRFNKTHVAEAMSSLLEKLLDNKKSEVRDIAGIALKTVAEEMPNSPTLTGKNVAPLFDFFFCYIYIYIYIYKCEIEIIKLSSPHSITNVYIYTHTFMYTKQVLLVAF